LSQHQKPVGWRPAANQKRQQQAKVYPIFNAFFKKHFQENLFREYSVFQRSSSQPSCCLRQKIVIVTLAWCFANSRTESIGYPRFLSGICTSQVDVSQDSKRWHACGILLHFPLGGLLLVRLLQQHPTHQIVERWFRLPFFGFCFQRSKFACSRDYAATAFCTISWEELAVG
jgi:hypothetical protein